MSEESSIHGNPERKIIEAEWIAFAEATGIFEPETPKIVKRTFYAGFACFYTLTRKWSGELSEDDAIEKMNEIKKELHEFAVALRQGKD